MSKALKDFTDDMNGKTLIALLQDEALGIGESVINKLEFVLGERCYTFSRNKKKKATKSK
jgi:hypothetical protein